MLTPSLAPGMPIFYCRALEIRIPITKVRQKKTPMDLKTQAAALRLQDESLSQPATELDQLPIPSAQPLKDKVEEAVTTSLVAHVEEAIAFLTALGPAGEILRLAGDRAAHLHGEVQDALREGLSEFEAEDGIRAPSSTWLVTASA